MTIKGKIVCAKSIAYDMAAQVKHLNLLVVLFHVAIVVSRTIRISAVSVKDFFVNVLNLTLRKLLFCFGMAIREFCCDCTLNLVFGDVVVVP